MKIIESKYFKKQLRNIVLYIKRDKITASVKFAKELKIQINDIPNMPKKYRKSQYYNDENMRDMIYKGYTIIYEIRKNAIEIHDIFKQNLPIQDKQ